MNSPHCFVFTLAVTSGAVCVSRALAGQSLLARQQQDTASPCLNAAMLGPAASRMRRQCGHLSWLVPAVPRG